MFTKRKGLAIVVILMLVLILSTPVFADAGLTAFQGRKIENQDKDMYQQHLEIIEEFQQKFPEKVPGKVLLKPISPAIPRFFDDDDADDVYKIHLKIIEDMTGSPASIKPHPAPMPIPGIPPLYDDGDVNRMHETIARELGK